MKYYKDDITGSYYAFESGELVQYPQNLDGSRDESNGAVDWDFVALEPPTLDEKGNEVDLYRHLKKIEKKLKGGEKK